MKRSFGAKPVKSFLRSTQTGSVSINDVTREDRRRRAIIVGDGADTLAVADGGATSDATATVADSDYVAASNILHFGANETISVTINGDTKVEADETFNVLLSNATNGEVHVECRRIAAACDREGRRSLRYHRW
jgi:hypothetical protein